ncbi:unnamed protein product [Gadus morhua 'NCC']
MQTFMILNELHRDLDVAVKLVQGGKDYQPPTIAADEDLEIAASLDADAEEEAHRTAGLQQPKPASQPEWSSVKRKARSSASQAGVETGRRTGSLERSGAVSEDESEIDFNEYQEVTMEKVQQPVEGESVDALGKFVPKGRPEESGTPLPRRAHRRSTRRVIDIYVNEHRCDAAGQEVTALVFGKGRGGLTAVTQLETVPLWGHVTSLTEQN